MRGYSPFSPVNGPLNVAENRQSAIVLRVAPSRKAFELGVLALAMAVGTGAKAALWVSADGDDGNPGTEERPLRTIGRARDVVRTLNRDMSDDITVFIGGAHSISRPIEFGPEDSGTNGYSIIYTAAPGERPVLSGGLRVSGWAVSDGARNLWSAPAPEGLADTGDLFVNGEPASRTRGRLPRAPAPIPSGDAAPPPAPGAQWRNPGDVLPVPAAPDAIWSERAGPAPVFVENAFELLGTPGKWYFDRTARRIYYTPRPGEDMRTADVEAAAAQALIRGMGRRDRPLLGLIFKGLRFEYTTSPNPQAAAAPRTPGGPPAAVSFALAGEIQFLEDDFLHFGTPALDLGPALEGGTVEGCVFADVSWSAIRIERAARIRIAESRISHSATRNPGEGAIEADQSDDISIEHDQIDDFPSVAVLELGGRGGALREDSDLIAPPTIGFHGAMPPVGTPGSRAVDAGVSPDYHAVIAERFSVPTVPDPPTGVAAEAEDTFAYVTWIPTCLDGGSPVAAYTVTASTGASATVTAADFQARGYMVMTGLENGRAVSFAVASVSALGAGPPSLPTAAVVPGHKRRLRAPPPPLVSAAGSAGGVRIEITPPAANAASPVVAYSVTLAPSGARVLVEGLDVIHSDAAHPVVRTIAGIALGPGTAVFVAARNAAGEGKPAAYKVRP